MLKTVAQLAWFTAVTLGGLVFFLGTAQAGFNLVDDFDSLVVGQIGGQDDWSASTGVLVVVDPINAANQVLAVSEQSVVARASAVLPVTTTRMLFLRFRFAEQLTASFGMSHLNYPSEFSDFGPEVSLVNSSPDLRVANGDTTGIYDTVTTVTADTWYNMWMLIDHDTNTTQFWLNSTPGGWAQDGDKLSNEEGVEVFGFRTSSGVDLKKFYLKTGSGGSGGFGPLYIDDIYLEDTPQANFSNPTAPLPGDFNLSGTVDADDLAIWQTEYATGGGADADGDGDSDGADFLIWQRNFTEVTGVTVIAVPEPGTLMLWLACGLGTLARRLLKRN